jgi:hypothetical protein
LTDDPLHPAPLVRRDVASSLRKPRRSYCSEVLVFEVRRN